MVYEYDNDILHSTTHAATRLVIIRLSLRSQTAWDPTAALISYQVNHGKGRSFVISK